VVANDNLILACDNVYKQFAAMINAHLRAVKEDEIVTVGPRE